MTALFEFVSGRIPLLVSFPHSGTVIPDEQAARMTDIAHTIPDTDWHVPRLYTFLNEVGASRIVATHSRYVVDLNRPPDSAALYPGQKNTGLVPIETFDGDPLYTAGREPDDQEITARRAQYFEPYHAALKAELDRLVAAHDYALLWDAHSIKSEVPELFEGRLPDFNIGTNSGASTPAEIAAEILAAANKSGHTSVANGRFKGGYITRQYGNADSNIFSVQLEMAQAIYMDEAPPFAFDEAKAPGVSATIRAMIEAYVQSAHRHFKR
ncbi:MAG TPA: N-formylglutamate deformylase [Rhizomicrobium sp.]|jgi:N-formylglutamate deformylase|nr:N-formylglutamate deformylase [Rhizomicrobium sp.]